VGGRASCETAAGGCFVLCFCSGERNDWVKASVWWEEKRRLEALVVVWVRSIEGDDELDKLC